MKSSPVPYVQQWAGAATAVAALAEPGFASVPEVSTRQGKALSSSRPEDWQLAHTAFLTLVSRAAFLLVPAFGCFAALCCNAVTAWVDHALQHAYATVMLCGMHHMPIATASFLYTCLV
jgi:hypothetical protein